MTTTTFTRPQPRRRKISPIVALFSVVTALAILAPSTARAAPAPAPPPVLIDSGSGVSTPTTTRSTTAGATIMMIGTTFCGYAEHTQYSQDVFTRQMLGSHKLREYWCWDETTVRSVSVSVHVASPTFYGNTLNINWYATDAPVTRFTSASVQVVGYSNYSQCYPTYCRYKYPYIVMTFSPNGHYSWAVYS